MRCGLFRCLLGLLMLGAFLCAGLAQAMPTAVATSMASTPGMSDMASMPGMSMHQHDTAPMPCKGPIPNCCGDIGCIAMVALPPGFTPTVQPLVWSRVTYANFALAPAGVSPEPDLGPPIQL
jgi:hypothetical protein